MYNFKRGDIVAKQIGPGQVEFSHLEQIGADGKMSAISDETGKPVGLDARRDALRVATMDEVLEARARRERRQGPAEQPEGGCLMINLKYDLYGAGMDGDNRHAQVVMRELGITYAEATPQSIADSWWFWDCKNVPEPLPKHFGILTADPKKWMTHPPVDGTDTES